MRAVYSDGTTEDVTRLAKFASSEELVAGVNEDGLVTVERPRRGGDHRRTSAPRSRRSPSRRRSPNASTPRSFAKSPRNNFIDELVLKKLELLRLPPSGTCTDAEFIRRAYLDTCGILPPASEVETFLADTDPKKRAKLIDRLLERPEFVDYWAYKWSDLLLVSSRKLPQPAMWAFYRKVRQSVADNKPWDRFARDILTASGSTLTNGGGNYFVLHKDVSDLAEATAVTFLGMSVTCAHCHNHPLEKWTQDQYWAYRQSVLARRTEERRPRRARCSCSRGRRRRAAPAPRRRDAADAARRQAARRSTRPPTAAPTSPTG